MIISCFTVPGKRRRTGYCTRPCLDVCLAMAYFNGNIPAGMDRWRGTVDHGVGILDAHTVGPAVILHHVHHRVVGFGLGPVTLPLKHHLDPGHWLRTSLLNATHGCLVRSLVEIPTEVLNGMDFKAVIDRLTRWERDADLCPQPCQDDLLFSAFLHGSDEVVVVPGVHTAAFDWGLVGINGLELWPDIPAKGLAFDGAQNERNVEDFGGLGKADDIVDQRLPINTGHAEQHLWLVIDQGDHTIVGCE